MKIRCTAFALLALCLAALPAAAIDPVIQRGIDLWATVPEKTFASFESNPLPAGFFCSEFPGFTGQIWLKGVPVASDNPRALGTTDTIIERVDNAAFNKRGVARTRARVRALQLTGTENLKTVCGDYNVKVTLDGEQPLSPMRIVRESDRGGRFFVPLSINVKFIFTRVDNPSEQLEFSDSVRLVVSPNHHWSYRTLAPDSKRVAKVTVDSDWDGTPDAFLPGTSNFLANRRDGQKVYDDVCPIGDGGAHGVTEPGPLPTAGAGE